MMRIIFLCIIVCVTSVGFAQKNERISTIDFVQIIDDNKEETVFYYENNWKVLREMALKRNYIASYELLETSTSQEAPFHIMLITTYLNEEQYAHREERFAELIKEKGELKLINNKKPAEFRKTLFNKEDVKHLN